MARIVLDGVTKRFGSDVIAVNDVSLEVRDGEFMVLVGPSGCGKSTLLRIVAGLEEVTAGEVQIGDEIVTDLPAKEREIAMVFQNYALFPHMTVAENIGFGLRLRRVPRAERDERVQRTAAILGIEGLLQRKPAQLSGGQLQRVAMGRAMVRQPTAFLMDEPLSNLDAKLRVQMRAELASIHRRTGTTALYVTHDQVEAMTLGDRVAVLNNGVLQQVDTPKRLYDYPQNLFVAAFMGSPSMNLVMASIEPPNVVFGDHSLRAPEHLIADHRGDVILGIRPSAFRVSAGLDLPQLEVEVRMVEELGSEVHLLCTVKAPPVLREDTAAASGDNTEAAEPSHLLAEEGTTPFTAIVESDSTAGIGDRVRLSVDPRSFHFFDPQSGVALGTQTKVGGASAATLATGQPSERIGEPSRRSANPW
jgi:multiple sugar transport system ATP-binding protein